MRAAARRFLLRAERRLNMSFIKANARWAWLLLATLLVAGCGQSQPERGDGSELGRLDQAISPTCPSGNGLFVLYYGTAASEIATIRAARPNFVVVANEDATWPDQYHYDNPAAHTGPTGIKVLAYIPMNYARQNECASNNTPNTNCTNTSCNGCSNCVPIQTRIANAMARGYDGVFFDETEDDHTAYNNACYNTVKASGAGKLVVVNPGIAAPLASLFDSADIVSVENQYNVSVAGYGQPSWRWLAVQGDPAPGAADLADEQARFNTFRSNGGFWYYSASPHWALETWFNDFAGWAKTQGNVACGASSFTVNVNGKAMDNGNAPVNGMCVFVDGSSSCSGFTPFSTTLSGGTHTITMTDFGSNVFDHWDNGSTSKARTVNVTGNAMYDAFYRTKVTVNVNALNLDNGNAPINGMCVFVDTTSSCAGFTPFTTQLTPGTHTITMTDFGSNVFHHWDNGSTSKARTVSVTTNSTYNAYYHTQ
jgi:Spherulation-specific family 4